MTWLTIRGIDDPGPARRQVDEFLTVTFQLWRIVEHRRTGAAEAVVQVTVLARVADEQALTLRRLTLTFAWATGLGPAAAAWWRRHADVERLEQLAAHGSRPAAAARYPVR